MLLILAFTLNTTVCVILILIIVTFCDFREELTSSHRLVERKDGEIAHIRFLLKVINKFDFSF